MAETPLDLSKLPCPQGCRWEKRYADTFHLYLGNMPVAVIRVIGRVWTWRVFKGGGYDHDADGIDDAVKHVVDEIGLTPAPAADLDAQLAAMSEEARAAFAAKYGWDKAAPTAVVYKFPVMTVNRSPYPQPARLIPWSLIEDFDPQARLNHGGQNLEMLASRGGCSRSELHGIIFGRTERYNNNSPENDAALAREFDQWLEKKLEPAGRTFTEAEMRRACLYSIAETAKGLLGVDYSRASDFEELNESVITAAIAAATDAGKDGPQ